MKNSCRGQLFSLCSLRRHVSQKMAQYFSKQKPQEYMSFAYNICLQTKWIFILALPLFSGEVRMEVRCGEPPHQPQRRGIILKHFLLLSTVRLQLFFNYWALCTVLATIYSRIVLFLSKVIKNGGRISHVYCIMHILSQV